MDELTKRATALLTTHTDKPPGAAPGQELLPAHTRCDVTNEGMVTPAWRAREGAATLFVHGWDDTHRVWRTFAQDFLVNSRPVLVMDLPAHGASKESVCSRQTAGQSVHDVCAAEGPIDTIIAHSFGCIATVRAIELGATADYLVLIAPPMRSRLDSWTAMQRRKGADEAVIQRAIEIETERGGQFFKSVDFVSVLSGFQGKTLFVGSDTDEHCSPKLIQPLVDRLPNAQLAAFEDIDHRDLALHTGVLENVLEFLGYQ